MPGNIHVPISFNIDGLTRSVQQINRLSGTLRKLGTAFVAVGTVAAAGIGRFTGESIQGAMELERNLAGLESVFKSSTEQMVEFSRGAANLGLSLSEAAKASTFIGSVLKQSGFALQETADLTEDLVTLGADLALTYGYDIQEALLAMTALFRGEYDPIEKFGVAMKQSEIDTEKTARSLDGLTGAAERFADQQIRLELLMERSSDAQGALERQSENLAVKQMQLRSAFLNLRDTMTLDLLPVFAKLTGMMTDQLIRATPPLQNAFAKLETPLLRIADQIGPVLEEVLLAIAGAVEALADFLTDATDPTTELGDALQGMSNRFDLAGEAIAPVIEAIGDFFESIYKVIFGDRNPIEFLVTGINQIIDAFSHLFTFLQVAIEQDVLAKALMAQLRGGTNASGPIVDEFFDEVESRMQNRANQLSQMNLEQDTEFLEKEMERRRQAFRESEQELHLDVFLDTTPILDDDTTDETVKEVTDYVAEFFGTLADEIAKQSARLELQGIGLEDAVIQQILNSQGWQDVYETIIEGGENLAKELNAAFFQTEEGMEQLEEQAKALAEAVAKTQEEMAALNEELAQLEIDKAAEIAAATEQFLDFKESIDNSVDALQTYTREIGQFEQQTRKDLERIEKQIEDAFDNGYLLADAKENLLEYARAELGVLIEIQRQRDELLTERNAAADIIFGVARAITASGQITSLLRNVQDEVEKVQVKELFEDVVNSADGLKEFKLTVERNYTETVKSTISQSAALVSSFQDVVDRTRKFIDNLKELRKLGLDPFLFNQLVEAGAEAGGATAQALVEGGADTVNEVNELQAELESLGVELGEQTYEVTKNSGAQFVSGIVDGMDDELSALQQAAMSIAENFGQTFAEAMNAAMKNAFDGILEGIKSEFAALMSELQALLDELRNMQTNVYPRFEGDQPYMPELVDPRGPIIDVPRIRGPEIIQPPSFTPPGPAPDPFGGYRTSSMTTVNIINTNNPLDAYNASKGNVEQQSTFQSANGNIQATLTGVGS